MQKKIVMATPERTAWYGVIYVIILILLFFLTKAVSSSMLESFFLKLIDRNPTFLVESLSLLVTLLVTGYMTFVIWKRAKRSVEQGFIEFTENLIFGNILYGYESGAFHLSAPWESMKISFRMSLFNETFKVERFKSTTKDSLTMLITPTITVRVTDWRYLLLGPNEESRRKAVRDLASMEAITCLEHFTNYNNRQDEVDSSGKMTRGILGNNDRMMRVVNEWLTRTDLWTQYGIFFSVGVTIDDALETEDALRGIKEAAALKKAILELKGAVPESDMAAVYLANQGKGTYKHESQSIHVDGPGSANVTVLAGGIVPQGGAGHHHGNDQQGN